MSTFTTTTEPVGLSPDVTFVASDILPDALIYQLATIAGDVDGDQPSLRVPYISDEPDVAFVPEGGDITPSEGALDEIVIKTGKLAVLSRQSAEAARKPDAARLVAESMSNAMTRRADDALLANVSGSANEPTGLFVDSTIPVASGTLSPSSGLSPVVQALAIVEANHGKPSALVTDPYTWALVVDALTDGAVSFGSQPVAEARRQLLGVPVVVSASVPVTVDGSTGAPTAGAMLVVDRSQLIAAVGELRLATSEHVYFGSDSVARRLTWRIGFGLVRPERFIKIASTLA